MNNTDANLASTVSVPSQSGESGQAAVALILILGLFLLGVFGFAVDLTNIWVHRQAARAASDSACQAGAMDMLASAAAVIPPAPGFTAGTASDCVNSSAATMCTYAKVNGYDGAGLNANAASNSVSWTFPASVTGVTPGAGAYPFLKVLISENVKTYFFSLVNASRFLNINVSTTCGVVGIRNSPPMVILNPTIAGALNSSGNAAMKIVGGPQRSIQINSPNSAAVTWSSSGLLDLSSGGPKNTGSDAGIVGGPTTPPGLFRGGSTGYWRSPASPIPDPFGRVPPPNSIKSLVPSTTTSGKQVPYGTDGCPDHNAPCQEFGPGYYPAGLTVAGGTTTAIFLPGIYYLNGPFTSAAHNNLRNAKPAGYQQTDGVMFYFYRGSFSFSGGTGSVNTGVDGVNSADLTCDGSLPPSSLNMPSIVYGNVLIAQCASNGTYWDSGGDTSDSRGTPGSRGILAFQDHSNTTLPSVSGSGNLAFSGAMYFHSSGYSDVLTLAGNGSSGTFILGEIIADQLTINGNGVVNLALNAAATTSVSKVAILQ